MFNYGNSFCPVLFDNSNEVSSFQIFFITTFPNNNKLELIK